MDFRRVTTILFVFVLNCLSCSAADHNCTCVSYNSCDSAPNYGEGFLDVRDLTNSPCENYYEVCCDPKHILTKPRLTAGIIHDYHKCGYNYTGESAQTAALLYKPYDSDLFVYRCGVAVIERRAVLTAAHCLKDGSINAAYWIVKIGRQSRRVLEIVIHPRFNPKTLDNNLAILILVHNIILSDDIGLICFAPNITPKSYAGCYSMGWSTINPPQSNEYHVVPRKRCGRSMRGHVEDQILPLPQNSLCVVGPKDGEMCGKNGGGPLICPISGETARYHLVGIAQWKPNCDKDSVVMVYVQISAYMGWIDSEFIINDFLLHAL